MFSKIALEWRLRQYRIENWLAPDVREVHHARVILLMRQWLAETRPWHRARIGREIAYWKNRADATESGYKR